jgi:hypothetical protein
VYLWKRDAFWRLLYESADRYFYLEPRRYSMALVFKWPEVQLHPRLLRFSN